MQNHSNTTSRLDLTGQRFGRLVAIREASRVHRKQRRWTCICDCGKTGDFPQNSLRSGNTRSCGCLQRDLLRERRTSHGHARVGKRSSEHNIWCKMIERCTKPTDPAFKWYGARGISVCERWRDYSNFFSDMGPRPSTSHTLDRIDCDGNYCPENCRWATWEEQQNNRRNNRIIEINGEALTMAQWSERLGLSDGALRYRLKHGWSGEQLLRPAKSGRYLTAHGRTMRLSEWANELGIPKETIAGRLRRGDTAERALRRD